MIKFYRAILTESYRNPKQYLKLGESTRLTDATISFTKSSAYDLVIKGLDSLLQTSPKCQKLHYERDMTNPEYTESGKILFCNTSKGNSILRVGDIFYDCISEPIQLVGRNLISVSATELSFLKEVMPEEKVMKLVDEMFSRVHNRFGYNNPNVSLIVDSSPNSMERLADQWIEKHKNDKDKLFINDKKWELPTFSWMFPIYEKDKKNIIMFIIGNVNWLL